MPFAAIGERDVHAWGPFRLVEADFTGPGGEPFSRTFLRHPGAVAVVPIDGDEVILVRQFRAAIGTDLLEIPAGTLDKGDTEEPLACAQRELIEEAGAEAERWTHLATYAVAAGISDEYLHVYAATGLTFVGRKADGVEEENMTVERLALSAVPEAIADGRIADAKSIIGLLLAQQRPLG